MENKITVGITHGDPNGVGYETILRVFEDPRMFELADFVLYGSAKIISFYRKALELPQIQLHKIESADQAQEGGLNVVNVTGDDFHPEPGKATAAAGAAAVAALEAAVADLRAGNIDVLVTAPIDKKTAQSETFQYPGHTEFLEATLVDADTPDDDAKALMVLAARGLRVALVTSHLPIKDVAPAITKDLILDKIRRFARALHRDWSIDNPRIAVLALNPHAGDDGLLGSEERDEIIPAIEAARQEKILAFGPYAADGFFGAGNHGKFDGILAMYHDQGLAPFKALSMEEGVNVSSGLTYIRTSPAHGTGFDIAGRGVASPTSLREAIYTAIDLYRNRTHHDFAHSRPLRRQNIDKEK